MKEGQPKELAQQIYFSSTTGLSVMLPPEATMRIAQAGREGYMPPEEGERLRAIHEDKNMRRRYPSVKAGMEFMREVSLERREELFAYSTEMTEEIVTQWKRINPNEPITVLLFGSMAKGTVKSIDNTDPSNVDLGVIGNITDREKERLYDRIRPKRKAIQEKILADYPNVDSEEGNPGNVGVMVQDMHSVLNGSFEGAMLYITAGAFPIYDPENKWSAIEQEALRRSAEQTASKRKFRSPIKFKKGRPTDVEPLNQPGQWAFQHSFLPSESIGDMIALEMKKNDADTTLEEREVTSLELAMRKGLEVQMTPRAEYKI